MSHQSPAAVPVSQIQDADAPSMQSWSSLEPFSQNPLAPLADLLKSIIAGASYFGFCEPAPVGWIASSFDKDTS